MVEQMLWVRRLIANMPAEREAWRTFSLRLMMIAGAFAFSIWGTVRAHPEQDLPLWPAWVLAGVASLGLAVAIASARALRPFRARGPHHHG
jgi:hypothetical protein